MSEAPRFDLLVRNATVVTMNRCRTIIDGGSVAVRGREIAAVGPDREVARLGTAEKVIDAGGAVVHPGYIDAHVHVSHANARGAFPDTVGFEEGMLLYARWWNALTSEDERASAMAVAAELVSNGTTTFVEAGTALEPAVVADAAEKVGIRALVADPWLWDVPNLAGADDRRIPPSLERSLELVGHEARTRNVRDELVRGYVALYGIGTSSDELVTAAKQAASDCGTVFCQHQSFAPTDVERDCDRFGQRPLRHYRDLGVLDGDTVFIHMNLLDDSERRDVVESGMGVVSCASSEMIWGTGGSRVSCHDHLHRSGCAIGFGSDSGNSALRWDTSEQALLALLAARERERSRDALLPEDALEMLTIEAARAFKLDDIVGSIEVGKRADFVIRDPSLLTSNPRLDLVQGLVLTQRSRGVGTVVVDGRIVLRDGRSTRVDAGEIAMAVHESAGRMMERVGLDARPRWPVVR